MVLPLGRHAAFGTFEWWWVASMVGLIAGLIAACCVDLGRGFGNFAAGSAYQGVMSFGQCLPQVPSASFPPVFVAKLQLAPGDERFGLPPSSTNPYVCHPRLTTTTGRAFFHASSNEHPGFYFRPQKLLFLVEYSTQHLCIEAPPPAQQRQQQTERGVGFSKLRVMGNYLVQPVQPVTTAF